MRYIKTILVTILIGLSCVAYGQEEITDILPAGLYQFNTVRVFDEDKIPTISSSEVEIIYEDSIPYIELHGNKLRIYFSFGDRRIPSITFSIEPKQENNTSTPLIVYTALKNSSSGRFEGRRFYIYVGSQRPDEIFFNIVPLKSEQTN
ncbi:hypothetical protein QEH59_18220 [Coraliomargarita sp. SDUM461004]|uniref:Uncharacterized protein n=1 Tax=Thalassobacterium sedimentorum TaxID=3041258 RepID=A0ABU1ANS7_9BACT|nr:hypothetical protein [Coraliomargarita sp. SDUM461004]MDQ8196372.1 hypothetical protein [Coraliomargarita sp. SDUM461004]